MRRRGLGAVLSLLLLAVHFPAEAQHAPRKFRIAFLIAPSASFISNRVAAFRQRMSELGYVEGTNIVIEYRYAEGKLDRLPQLAAELVDLNADVIVTVGPSNRAAMKATSRIPIVTTGSSDPVKDGLISSLSRPGGNITGLSLRFPQLDRKRLELLHEVFPKVSRVAFLWASGTERGAASLDVEAHAKALQLELLPLEIRNLEELATVLARAKADRAEALIATSDPRINMQHLKVLEFAEKARLPAMFPTSEFVEVGGLMSYGPNYQALFRRAADLVHKILKGSKPADIPFEQPTRLEFVINLRAAKQIGVTIPPETLVWADRVIR